MKTRRLLAGGRAKEAPEEVTLKLITKCPAKWLVIDLETGDVWKHKDIPLVPHCKWWQATPSERALLRKTLEMIR